MFSLLPQSSPFPVPGKSLREWGVEAQQDRVVVAARVCVARDLEKEEACVLDLRVGKSLCIAAYRSM